MVSEVPVLRRARSPLASRARLARSVPLLSCLAPDPQPLADAVHSLLTVALDHNGSGLQGRGRGERPDGAAALSKRP